MRIRTTWGLLICGALLTACTAGPPKGPAATVTTPAVGRPPAPASVAAAMSSSEVFTPYAALGAADNDGLAPGDTYDALHTACMNDAGYGQYAAAAAYPARTNRGLGFPQAYGPWGYVGTALAAQEGFLIGSSGPGGGVPVGGGPFASLPTAAQAAAGKCFNILENSSPDAEAFWAQALDSIGQGSGPGQNPSGPPGPPTTAQNKAQIAMAVADANCTLSSDLAGIYFAVQANYEQQFVSANQQALNAGVREYKAAFAKAIKDLPSLLQATSAVPNLPGPPRRGHHGAVKPSPSHS